MPNRTVPFPAYQYLLALAEPGESEIVLGGFSNMSKLTGLHKVGDITLKRGVVDSSKLWDWINQVRSGNPGPRRNGSIILRDETHTSIQSWKLRNAAPVTYTGPPLTANGGDVAVEELILSAETIEIVPA